jgi:hypothetical protein
MLKQEEGNQRGKGRTTHHQRVVNRYYTISKQLFK